MRFVYVMLLVIAVAVVSVPDPGTILSLVGGGLLGIWASWTWVRTERRQEKPVGRRT